MKYMKKTMEKNMRRVALLAALAITISVFGNVPGYTGRVYATDASGATTEATTTNTTTTSAGTTSTTEAASNIDPNGTLGKNSDVGVEVTESIIGVAGKDVTVSFKLNSGNANTIKIKSVYPVIDSVFPFDTSGDAYKVVAAGDDPAKQLSLDASYTMKARSDLADGYQSVRFIGEYSKLDADGTSKDYYVIKTINIYFSATEPTTESKTTSSKSSSKKKETATTEPEDDSDDDTGTSSYSGGGYTGGSSSGDGETEAPKLIIKGFDTDPKKVMAGDSFKMTIHVTNSSKTTNVCNGKFLIGDEGGNFLPTSGSNAVFVEKIAAGETGDIEIELKTSADLAQKNYRLVLKGDFDDGNGNTFSASESVYLPVYQEVKMNITDASMTPSSIGIGSQGSLVFTINNQSSANVFNVSVSSPDDAVSAPESYVGNIAANSSAYATLEVTGKADNSDRGTIKVKITYEDADGETGELELDVACSVGVDAFSEGFEDYDEDYEDEYDEGIPWWVWLIVGVVVVAAIVVVIVVLVKKKKKKLAELMAEEDDDDFFGDGESEGSNNDDNENEGDNHDDGYVEANGDSSNEQAYIEADGSETDMENVDE